MFKQIVSPAKRFNGLALHHILCNNNNEMFKQIDSPAKHFSGLSLHIYYVIITMKINV